MDAQGAGRGIAFQMPQITGLLFPPPPPPQILSYSSSYTSPTSHHPSITSFPILLLTVLGILTTSVLLLTYYVFVIRCCLNWHDSSNVAGLIARGGRRGGGTVASGSSLPVTGTPAEARGLQESTIQALPTFRYRKAIKSAAADSAPTSECAVCLGEFEEEERVRMLPRCLHAFHVDCVDTWLQGNANCPLCRATITGPCIIPLDQLQRPEEAVIQVATRTEVAQQRHASISAAESAGATATAQQVSSDKRNYAWRDVEISSKEDEWAAVKKDRDVLPLRRSSSMGSMGGEEVRLQIQNILQRNAHFHRDDTGCSSTV